METKAPAVVEIFEGSHITSVPFHNATPEFLSWLIKENGGGITIWFVENKVACTQQ